MVTQPRDDAAEEELQSDDNSDIIDTPDGGAIVQMREDKDTDPEPADDGDFYDNLILKLDPGLIDTLETELWRKIEFDQRSREKRDKQYAEGIRRTGLGDDAPGGAKFQGASKVVHPMMTKACIDFGARTVKEFMPKGDMVKEYIAGTCTKNRLEKSRRVSRYLNWQLLKQMRNLRSEFEQTSTQSPLAGAGYLRLIHDEDLRRPMPIFVPIDDVLLPFGSTCFLTAERITYVEHISEFEFERRKKSGRYIDEDVGPSSQLPTQTKSAEASQKVEGVSVPAYNEDGLRNVFEVSTRYDLKDRKVEDGRAAPYLITIDGYTRKAISIVRNWEEDDDKLEAMMWMVEFGFIPWRGPYPIGFAHIIGGLSGALTGAVRALLDSALISNMPSMLKIKGAGTSGQNANPAPTEITEIYGPPGIDDIRKLVMPVPYSPPSMVLFQLLGFLVEQGEGVVRIALDQLTENPGQQLPVGTTLALIEQGMKVLASIHSRWHASFQQFLEILFRINRMYLTDEEVVDETGELMVYRKDFQGPMDIIPVSDPEIFTDVQRFAQVQAVAQRSDLHPDRYDGHKVEKLILRMTRIPDAESLLVPTPEIEEMNAVNENVAITLGRPVHAYPDQDHLAHIQVLLDFMQSPMLGMNPIIAPTYLNGALNHLKEHVVMWYASYMEQMATAAVKKVGAKEGIGISELLKYQDKDTRQEADKLLATVSKGAGAAAQSTLQKIPQVIQQAQQMLQQFQQAAMAQAGAAGGAQAQASVQKAQLASADKQKELAQEAQQDQAENQLRQQELTQKAAESSQQQQAESQRTQQENAADMAETQVQQQHEDSRAAAANQTKESVNAADNMTALHISATNAAAKATTNVSTGTKIGKERSDE